MTIEFTTEKATLIFVKVRNSATDFKLAGNILTYKMMDIGCSGWDEVLPPGDWQLHGKVSELSEEVLEDIMDSIFVCPCCNGDGKETCTNPDHGFLSALSFRGANESRCPCCGHDPDHKVPNGGKCEVCDGTGECTEKQINQFEKEVQQPVDAEIKDYLPRFHSLCTHLSITPDHIVLSKPLNKTI